VILSLGARQLYGEPTRICNVRRRCDARGAGGSNIGWAVAVENDYNLLVHNLNEIEKTISQLRDEVEARRLREAKEQLEPNTTDWVNLIALQLSLTTHRYEGLQDGAVKVLNSHPGEAVFDAQPPASPDAPP
jgi:hypothetical protein